MCGVQAVKLGPVSRQLIGTGLKSAQAVIALAGDCVGNEPVNLGGFGVELAALGRQLRF